MKKIIFILIFILILGSWIYFYSSKNNINKETKKNNIGIKIYKKWSLEIKELNRIVSAWFKKEDLKNCDKLKEQSLKNYCVSKIKAKIKFPPNIILNGKCDTYDNTRDKDICLYNFYSIKIRDDSYKKKCLNISSKSIQNLCIAKIKAKLSRIHK